MLRIATIAVLAALAGAGTATAFGPLAAGDPQGPLTEYAIRSDGTHTRIVGSGPTIHRSDLYSTWRSADGTLFALLTGSGSASGLYAGKLQPPSTGLTRLTPPSLGVTNCGDICYGDPTYSASGRWIAFASIDCPPGGCDPGCQFDCAVPSVYVARTDGSILRRLDGGFLPQWTPGGRILYLGWTGSYNEGTQTGVFTIDVGGRTRRRLSKTLVYGKLSPDGKLIAVSCGKPRVRRPGASPVQPNLCAEPLDGSRPHVIARPGLAGPTLEFDWSPDDRQLAMIYQDGRIAVASVRTHSGRVRIVARMRNPVAAGLPIVWSPDGRRFAYTDFALNAAGYYLPELYVVTIKTRQARFLTARAGTTVNVRWSSPTTLTYLALGAS